MGEGKTCSSTGAWRVLGASCAWSGACVWGHCLSPHTRDAPAQSTKPWTSPAQIWHIISAKMSKQRLNELQKAVRAALVALLLPSATAVPSAGAGTAEFAGWGQTQEILLVERESWALGLFYFWMTLWAGLSWACLWPWGKKMSVGNDSFTWHHFQWESVRISKIFPLTC